MNCTTRAYDPTLGRFLARDPLGRVPLYFADNPYAYAGNNPLSNVDPSGQYRAAGHGSTARESGAATNKMMARVVAQHGTPSKGGGGSGAGCGGCKVKSWRQAVAAQQLRRFSGHAMMRIWLPAHSMGGR